MFVQINVLFYSNLRSLPYLMYEYTKQDK